jgi:Transposase DDE domain
MMEQHKIKSRKHLFLTGLTSRTRTVFEKIKDDVCNRGPISLTDCLMSGMAMFGLKYPSLLKFDTEGRDKDSPLAHNLHKLYGIKQIPSDTYMRERLDELDPKDLQKPINRIITQLQRGKVIEQYQYHDDYCLIALDASGYFSSKQVHCENCCEKHHKDGTITFYHQMLAAVMVNPRYPAVFPIMIEPIQKQDGNTKNDCEHSAAKRLLKNLRAAHPHLKMIVVMDGLYADGVIISLLEELKLRYIITAKEDDLKHLFEFYRSANHKETTESDAKARRTYRYAERLPLNDTHNDIEVNVLECFEETKNKKNRFCWITDLPLNNDNVNRIVKGGRARWKIENETFNTLKNQGYQFEHNFGHGDKNLNVVFAYLMFTAFLIDQVQEFSCKYFKAALKTMRNKKKYLWERIRNLFFEYFIDTWEQLYSGIIDGIKPVRLGSIINHTG